MRQASEKGWGAAAIAVKAVAEQRGWEHGSHEDLFAAVDRLARELPEADLRTDFQVAASLHQNFYEGWQTADMVEHGPGAGAAVRRDGDEPGGVRMPAGQPVPAERAVNARPRRDWPPGSRLAG